MKTYDVMEGRLLHTEEIAAGIYDFVIEAPDLAQTAEPGQFLHIRLPGRALRRPISICGIDRKAGTLRIVFQIRGEGTAELAGWKEGDSLDVLGPLGKGFPVDCAGKRLLLVGGGIGVPPLLGVAEALGKNTVAVLGFRNRDAVILERDFQNAGSKTLVATDDGSYGHHGLVIGLAEKEEFDCVYACGPTPMLKAVCRLAGEREVPCFISLEERMACGIGACLGCATPLLREGGEPYYGHVCKDGPVFDYRRVVLE